MAQAAALGTGLVANAYTVSNTLPNQIYELFMGGLLSSIFIPLLVERLTRYGEEDARTLTNALLTVILPVITAVTLLGVLLAGPIVSATTDWGAAKNLSPQEAKDTTDLAVFLFRIFSVQIFFYGIGALATGILNSHRRFFLPTVAPVLNNFTVIAAFAGYAVLAREHHVTATYVLAAGTTLGVAVMSLVLLPAVYRLGYRPRIEFGHPALSSAVRLAVPMVVFVAAAVGIQVAANLLGTQFAGVPNLWYAFTVYSLPYGVFVVAIATALMPELAEQFARGDTAGYRRTLSQGLRTMAFIIVPASVGMATLSTPIVGLLYERGEFSPADTASVAALLTAYTAGLLGYATYFLLIRAFYSRQNTRTPAVLNIGLFVLYTTLAYGLSRVMGLSGIAWAFSGANAVVALVCLYAMRREIKGLDGWQLLKSLSRILAAGALMFGAATAGIAVLGVGSGPAERILILLVVGGASLVVYLGAALLLRVKELNSALDLLRRRLG